MLEQAPDATSSAGGVMERTFICVCDPCGHKLEVERLKKYDSMCAEELLEIVKGSILRLWLQ